MKKLLTAIVISALCLGLCSGALAEGENVISADEFNGSAQPTAAPGEESAVCNPEEAGKVQRVFDLAELLTDDEEAELQSRINELVAKDGQDIGIVTVEDESVMSTQEFADEFYENSGMGIGENRTGVLFCIDMYNRETYLTTSGVRRYSTRRWNTLQMAITWARFQRLWITPISLLKWAWQTIIPA